MFVSAGQAGAAPCTSSWHEHAVCRSLLARRRVANTRAGQAGAVEREEGDELLEEERVGRRDAEILRSVSVWRSETQMVELRGYGWVARERAAQLTAERDQRRAEEADRRQRQRELALVRRAEREAGRPPPTERRTPQDWSEWRPAHAARATWWAGWEWRAGGSRGWRWDER